MNAFDFKKINKWFYAFAATAVLLIAAVIVAIVIGVNQDSGTTPVLSEGAETGVYYYDVAEGEVVISLHGGNKFTIAGPGYNKSGEYTINGSDITFDFFRDSDGTATAKLNGSTLALTQGDKTTEYLKKIPYSVSFNTNGGSDVAAVTVINGKTFGAPADPTKSGNVFLGWYSDAALTQPYSFTAATITADTTLYAKWAQTNGDAPEYVLNFVTGEGASAIDSMSTIGGKLAFSADYKEPVREGYTFVGWYASMSSDADKLSYEVKEVGS